MSTDIIDKLEADLMATRERGQRTLELADKLKVEESIRDLYKKTVAIEITVIDMALTALPELRESFRNLHDALDKANQAFARVEKSSEKKDDSDAQ
jgi:hypothetical protein